MAEAAVKRIESSHQTLWPRSLANWMLRFAATAVALAAWLVLLLFLLAYVLPSNIERLSDGTPVHSTDGLGVSVGVNVLLGLITALYYLAVLPMMLLPLREESRYNWFLFTAYGWILCLLGSLIVLRRLGLVEIGEVPLPLSYRAALITVGVVFLLALCIGMAPSIGGGRRPAYAAALAAGALATIGAGLAVEALADGLADVLNGQSPAGSTGFALIMASALCVLLLSVLLLPPLAAAKGELMGFLVLLWLFVLAAVVCWMIVQGRIHRTGDAGWEMFLCLVLTGVVAPLFAWLGMPWTRGSRAAWSVCLALAAGVVLVVAMRVPFEGSPNLIRHVFDSYDGPHFLRRTSLF